MSDCKLFESEIADYLSLEGRLKPYKNTKWKGTVFLSVCNLCRSVGDKKLLSYAAPLARIVLFGVFMNRLVCILLFGLSEHIRVCPDQSLCDRQPLAYSGFITSFPVGVSAFPAP